MNASSPLAVVAIGGHALQRHPEDPSAEGQWAAAHQTAERLADLAAEGLRLVVTHGNGPQVGLLLRRSELAAREVPPLSMHMAVAHTQGGIGYVLAQSIAAELARRDLHLPVAAVVTQTLVDEDDPAFKTPTKPIGSYMSEVQAKRLARVRGWHVIHQPSRGWRRVVASPRPQEVVELPAIRALVAGGGVVIAAGGGGIPVVRTLDGLRGVAAVVDKDLVSSLLARQLGADLLLLATDVEGVALNFGTPDETWLDRMTLDQARLHLAKGQFPNGSMGPKVTAAVEYVSASGGRAVISSTERLVDAWRGRAGTEVVRQGTDS